MSKPKLRLKAREMRSQGQSVKQISDNLHISKSTVSLWVRDIILSENQLQNLIHREIKGREKGRFMGAFVQKQKRLEKIYEAELWAKKQIGIITDRELFLSGLALYAGEGNKKTRKVRLCNSDPRIIIFMIYWLKKYFNLDNNDLRCFIGINEIHRKRENDVKEYWSRITGIPIKSFNKTSFKKTRNIKEYDNFNDHYGTLDVRVLHGAAVYYKIMGLLKGFFDIGIKQSQGSSVVVAAVS